MRRTAGPRCRGSARTPGRSAACCRSWSRCTGSGTTCTAAPATSTTSRRQQTWRHRVGDLADAGVLELATLEIDGELAAYTLGIHDDPTYRLLEGRFVTGWARYSPGRYLEALVVERALAAGAVTTFDWMTAVAPESLLGRNDADPMVLVRLG